jgi:hypothetical protein
MKSKHDADNELGRNLAAAYIAYITGRKSIDRVLNEMPEQIGEFWKVTARGLFAEHAARVDVADVAFRETITKVVQ